MTAIYFLNSGGEILEIMVPAWMGSGENLLLGCRLPPSCGEQNGEHALWCLLLEGTNPSYEGAALRPSSNPNHLPKAPLFNDITLRGRVSIADFRGSKHSYLNRGRNDTWFLWGHSFIHSFKNHVLRSAQGPYGVQTGIQWWTKQTEGKNNKGPVWVLGTFFLSMAYYVSSFTCSPIHESVRLYFSINRGKPCCFLF